MNKNFVFIGGCPRSGTSLLSALMGNFSGVGVVQDLSLFFYLKKAALQVMLEANGVPSSESSIQAVNIAWQVDLRQTDFFPSYLSSSISEALNQYDQINGRLLRKHLSLMDAFLFNAMNRPDPRKDRGQGAEYLSKIDLGRLMNSSSMSDALLEVLIDSASPLAKRDENQGAIDVICEKTPENIVSLDVIDSCFAANGFRFIHLVRDPVSVFGARRQRVDSSVEYFAKFFKVYSESIFRPSNCVYSSTIRYEDLVNDCQSEIRRVFSELQLDSERTFVSSPGSINPGRYISYVGSSVNPERDAANRANVSDEEKKYLYETLGDYCQKYGYGAFSMDL